MIKKILVFTCNRAEYSKLEPIIKYLNDSINFELKLIVVGSHLLRDYGFTERFINYKIDYKINTLVNSDSKSMMAESVGLSCSKLPLIFEIENPDAVIIHGDRFDVISIATISALMNTCLIHIEGGERSGTIDDHIRNCISKLASYHLVSNNESKINLIKMNEPDNLIYITGCPLYDKLLNFVPNKELDQEVKKNNYIICSFHPVTTDLDKSLSDFTKLVETLIEINKKIIIFYPNCDLGTKKFVKIIDDKLKNNKNFLILKSMENDDYLSHLYYASLIIGNSSSGIREAGAFGISSISLGNRQKNRSYDKNVIFLENFTKDELIIKINENYNKKFEISTLYGNGKFVDNFDKFMNSIEFNYKNK